LTNDNEGLKLFNQIQQLSSQLEDGKSLTLLLNGQVAILLFGVCENGLSTFIFSVSIKRTSFLLE
jgi:hypothetical protein